MQTASNQPKHTSVRSAKINTPFEGLHHSSCVVKSVQVMAVYGDHKRGIRE